MTEAPTELKGAF